MALESYINSVLLLEDKDTAGDVVRAKGTSDGYLVIDTEDPLDTKEQLNIEVAAASASGTNANPAAASKYMLIMNESAEQIRMAIGSTASTSAGITIYPYSGLEICSNVEISAVSIYNQSASTSAKVSILFAR